MKHSLLKDMSDLELFTKKPKFGAVKMQSICKRKLNPFQTTNFRLF